MMLFVIILSLLSTTGQSQSAPLPLCCKFRSDSANVYVYKTQNVLNCYCTQNGVDVGTSTVLKACFPGQTLRKGGKPELITDKLDALDVCSSELRDKKGRAVSCKDIISTLRESKLIFNYNNWEKNCAESTYLPKTLFVPKCNASDKSFHIFKIIDLKETDYSYVVIDPSDNSLVLSMEGSKELRRIIDEGRAESLRECKVFCVNYPA